MKKSLLLALSLVCSSGLYAMTWTATAAETPADSGAKATPAKSFTVTDARDRVVTITDASRIASIGGAVTEILYAMGLGDRIIAVDQTSTFPMDAKSKPQVGYTRTLSPEGVLSVGPSLILATDGSGPRTTIDVLEQASIPVVMIPEGHDAEGVLRKIELIAAAVGEPEKGKALADAVRADFETLSRALEPVKDRPRAVFVMSASGGAAVVGGSGTSADAMFQLAKATNAMADIKGYKPAQDEAAMISEPEAVVVMRDGGQKLDADTIFALPTFLGTPAARDRKLLTYPGSYLLGFGPRTPFAVRDLAVALHPGLEIPELPARPWHTEPVQ